MEYVVTLSHSISVLAVQILVQSTLIVGLGLLICLILPRRNPLLHNLICRLTLVALFVAPPALFLIRHAPAARYSVTLPLDTVVLQQPGTPSVDTATPVFQPGPSTPGSHDTQAALDNGEPHRGSGVVSPGMSAPPSIAETGSGIRYSPVSPAAPETHPYVKYIWIAYLAMMFVWVASIMFGVIRLILSYLQLRFIIRTGIPAEPEFHQLVEAHIRRMNMASPRIVRSPFAHSPFLSGFIQPVIVLPDYMTVTNDIILHELIHLKRHDIWWSTLGCLISVLLPIQPLMHKLLAVMEDTNDLICDRYVIEQLRNPGKYAARLVSLASLLCPRYTEDSLKLGLLPSRKSLKYRIERILDGNLHPLTQYRKRLLWGGGITVILCSVLTGFIEVRGVVMPSLFARSYIFSNTLRYVPGASRLVRTAQSTLELVAGLSARPAAPGSETPDGAEEASMAPGSSPETVLPRPDIEIVHAAAINAGNTVPVTAAYEHEPGSIAAPPVSRDPESVSVSGSVPPLTPDREYIGDFDLAAGVMHPAGLSTNGGEAMPVGDVGIPGSPRIIAEFYAAKPVHVTCDYDFGSLMPDSSQEEIEELEYFRSLDKYKQEVAWSPDGSFLAFTDNNRIWTVSIDGGDPVLVYEYKQNGYLVGAISDLCFTPAGSEIIFTKKTYDPELGSVITYMEREGFATFVSFANPIPNIESVNLETGAHRVIVEEACMGTLSRDGSCLFYIRFDPAVYNSRPDELHNLPMVLDFESGRSMVLSTKRQRYGRPTFSPDDTHVILPCYEYGQPEQLYRLNLSGGDPVQVTTWELWAPYGRNLRTPEFDPAGRWILYTDATWHADGPDRNLWVYSTVTGKQYPLFEHCDYEQSCAVWNPDGTKFCFIRKVDDTNYLYVMDFITPEAEKRIVRDMDKPLALELKQNYPNPFNIQTTIDFSIPESGEVMLSLYSTTGQKVRTLVDEHLDAGRHSVLWDGRDDDGAALASGAYLSRLTCNGCSRQGKMTLLK